MNVKINENTNYRYSQLPCYIFQLKRKVVVCILCCHEPISSGKIVYFFYFCFLSFFSLTTLNRFHWNQLNLIECMLKVISNALNLYIVLSFFSLEMHVCKHSELIVFFKRKIHWKLYRNWNRIFIHLPRLNGVVELFLQFWFSISYCFHCNSLSHSFQHLNYK